MHRRTVAQRVVTPAGSSDSRTPSVREYASANARGIAAIPDAIHGCEKERPVSAFQSRG